MPFLYLLNFINIIYSSRKNIAILSKNNNITYDKIIQDELTDRLNFQGFIIDYINGVHKYEISDENFNFILTNQNRKEKIKIFLENNHIYFLNINRNIKQHIGNISYNIEFPINYNDIDIYV